MKTIWLLFFFLFSMMFGFAQEHPPYKICDQDFRPLSWRDGLPENAVYLDTSETTVARAKDVVDRLTFDEKLELTGGWNRMYFPSVPRLGLRPIYFSDASQGIHIKNLCWQIDKSTSFPSELALAATWNRHLAYEYARNIGEEFKAWGISVLLGPGLNMYRNSEGGRNFEYMGEDPFLTSKIGVEYIKGLQSTGTMATVKHFIGNEQEFARHVVNVKMGERALREIYLPPFTAAINEAGALALMNGNNAVNGYPGAANKPISKDILRKEYNYYGIIMSDWANSTFWPDKQNMILGSGQSLLMSNNKLFAEFICNEIERYPFKKTCIEKALDTMVFHNLYAFFKMGFYDDIYRDSDLLKEIPSHVSTALKTAEEAITLLKNEDHILPVNVDKVGKIIVIGNKDAINASIGLGSGNVRGYNQVDYLTGLKEIYGNKIQYIEKIEDDKIRAADLVLYFVYKLASEGRDIAFDLPEETNKEILKCSQLNKNVVVIYSGGNGFSMPWISNVKGVIVAYLLGQESGNALADILSGKVNPSGKLPITIEKDFRDAPSYNYNLMADGELHWKGHIPSSKKYKKEFGGNIEIAYDEDVFIGYRWYEKKGIQPLFPFGFGLSYTSFAISDLNVSSGIVQPDKPLIVSFAIKNTGKVAGAEVAQLYIQKIDPKVNRPVKELKGFEKIFLEPGESKTVYIPVYKDNLAFWDIEKHHWKINPGEYMIEVGTSSQDIKERTKIKVL